MDNIKRFKSIKEQLNLLKERGLLVEDIAEAEEKLLFHNYYNLINTYGYVFKKDYNSDVFIEGTRLSDICNLYSFDAKLRNLVLFYTFIIEEEVKSVLAFYFSECSESVDHESYLDKSNFCFDLKIKNNSKLYEKLRRKIDETLDKKRDPFIKHYLDKYNYVPFWVLVKTFSLGNVSTFTRLIRNTLRQKISNEFFLSEKEILAYLDFLTLIRNEAAHNKRVFSFIYWKKKLPTNSYSPIIGYFKEHSLNNLFAVFLIFKRFLPEKDFLIFIESFDSLLRTLNERIANEIFMERIKNEMNFPENWSDLKTIGNHKKYRNESCFTLLNNEKEKGS